jgi:hypothetical protein
VAEIKGYEVSHIVSRLTLFKFCVSMFHVFTKVELYSCDLAPYRKLAILCQ